MKLACFLKGNSFCIMALRMPQTDEKWNELLATTFGKNCSWSSEKKTKKKNQKKKKTKNFIQLM